MLATYIFHIQSCLNSAIQMHLTWVTGQCNYDVLLDCNVELAMFLKCLLCVFKECILYLPFPWFICKIRGKKTLYSTELQRMYSGKKAITRSSICKTKTRLWGENCCDARYGSCRGCMKYMNPTKGNAICKWNICRKESACCYFCKSAQDLHGTRFSRNRCTHCMVFFICLFLHYFWSHLQWKG